MKTTIIWFLFGIILNPYDSPLCVQKRNTMSCDKKKAIEIAQTRMKKKGFNLDEFKCEATEDSLQYQIRFVLKDSLMEGGGGVFKISKENCSIIEQMFYQ